MFPSWSAWLGLGFAVFTGIINFAILVKVMNNDLHHIQATLLEIKEQLIAMNVKCVNHAERISTVEGKLSK